MNIILYSRPGDPAGSRLQALIETQTAGVTLEVYRTLDTLSERLHQPTPDVKAAVLVAAHQEDLLILMTLRPLLDGLRTILILPDRKANTVALGHQLRPRFLSDVDSHFLDVIAVINRMVGETGPTSTE